MRILNERETDELLWPKCSIARLGNGKWHIVRVYSSSDVHTACGITISGRVYDDHDGTRVIISVEQKNGEPTCAHCKRWWSKVQQ